MSARAKNNETVDLRSDTVTRPTAAMRAAMAAAEVGDDVFGDDPEVNALQAEVADLLGFEAGLFTPSGSLANQLGLRLLVRPGEEVVCDTMAHIARAELGAAAVFSGHNVPDLDAHAPAGWTSTPSLALIAPAAGPYQVSHDGDRGREHPQLRRRRRSSPPTSSRPSSRWPSEHGLGLHLDGARLWNAHVASGTPLRELTAGFDTVSVCLSKGLGAPVGSVLVSTAERIAEARVWRKRYGAGMRQVGILAAAGSLRAGPPRRPAGRGPRAGPSPGRWSWRRPVERGHQHRRSRRGRRRRALRAKPPARACSCPRSGPRFLRLVTHLDVDDAGVDRALQVLAPLI